MNKLTTAVYRFFQYIRWCFKGGYTQILLSQVTYPGILEGKRVLITGGSEGIGFEMARKFLSVGAQVVITGRNKERLNLAESKLASNRLHSLQWDVSDTDIIASKLEGVKLLMGGGRYCNKQCCLPNTL